MLTLALRSNIFSAFIVVQIVSAPVVKSENCVRPHADPVEEHETPVQKRVLVHSFFVPSSCRAPSGLSENAHAPPTSQSPRSYPANEFKVFLWGVKMKMSVRARVG